MALEKLSHHQGIAWNSRSTKRYKKGKNTQEPLSKFRLCILLEGAARSRADCIFGENW